MGDCLGAPFEGTTEAPTHQEINQHTASTDRLAHTDDTAQALAVARSLAYTGGRIERDHLAMLLASAWSADPRRGYGAGAAHLLEAITAGGNWRELAPAQFGGSGSWGNGAAMRTPPVAMVADGPGHAAYLAREQASVTHTHPLALDGAALIAVAVHLALVDGWERDNALDQILGATTTPAMRDAIERVAALPDGYTARDVAERLGNGVDAASSVPAAIALALRSPRSPLDVIRSALELGGDTDTIAAMATSIVGANVGIDAFPPELRARCEAAEIADGLARTLASLRTR